jgi:Domain of unknown function (DUF222)
VLSVVLWRVEPPRNVGAEPYIECAFENDLSGLDAADTLAAAEANEHALTTAETRRLQLAAHWADLHPGDAVQVSRIPGTERPIQLGGDGTPTIGDFAPTELGGVLRISDGSASRLIADALDLRHRLRLLWAAMLVGQAPAYQARHIAAVTRHLSAEQAGFVDQRLAPALGAISFGRLQALLQAAIIEADPVGAEQAAEAAAKERFVRLGRSSEHGLKMIFARVAAGDALWIKAAGDRIADILGRQGDSDSIEIRRSKALGILAQPAEALQLLCQHQDDDWDGSTEPDDLDLEPAQDQIDLDQTDAAAMRPEPVGGRDDAFQTDHTTPVEDDHSQGALSDEAAHRSLQIVPPPFDPNKARPRAIIYLHLSQEAVSAGTGVARVEEIGPVALSRLHMLLGDRCTITIKLVIDLPAGHTPVDAYEIPASLREQLLLRNPADVFPYAAAVSRHFDIDHTIPYLSPDRGGPPDQTRIGNVGPHTRYHHRVKTHGGWQVRQSEPGTWVWRSPHHRMYLVNATGTHTLGKSEFAENIWRAASQPQDRSAELIPTIPR